jgi:hypothetical protein
MGMQKHIWIAVLVLSLGACAQNRNNLANTMRQELWEPQEVCQVSEGEELGGCFRVQLEITGPGNPNGKAYIDVLDLGPDPALDPYRVMVRKEGSAAWLVLKSNITTTPGGTFEVFPKNSDYIEEYSEWRFETTTNYDPQGFLQTVAPLSGITLAHVIIEWPELIGAE